MRSRKKSRQTAESAANVRAQPEESAEVSAQSNVFDAIAPEAAHAQTSHGEVAADAQPGGAQPNAQTNAQQSAQTNAQQSAQSGAQQRTLSDAQQSAQQKAQESAQESTLVASPDEAATDFDAAAEGPEAQLAGVPDAELSMEPKVLLAHLRQRVLDNPTDVSSRIRLGQLHDRRSEPLLALEQYQAAVAADPDNALVVLQFAQALTNLNRFAEAERELRRVLKLEPDHGALHLQLGTISFRRGLYSQAEVELKRALELLPDAASAYFHRGESLNQLSRIDEALDMLERGVALDPTYSRAYYIMGILYDRKSRPQEAGAMYKKAREVAGT